MKKAVIFDIDGTLLDSVDLHASAWQEALSHFGYEVSFRAVRDQIGKGGDQLLPVFLSPEEMAKHGKELEQYRSSLFKTKFLPRVRPFPKVRELLLRVKSRGQSIALASSAKEDELEAYKKIANITDLVDKGTSSADAEKSQPHPDIFEAALDKLDHGIRPMDAVVVGDSPYDAQGARRAGIPVIGVLCGGFPAGTLLAAGCSALFADPEDLLRKYEDSPLASGAAV